MHYKAKHHYITDLALAKSLNKLTQDAANLEEIRNVMGRLIRDVGEAL